MLSILKQVVSPSTKSIGVLFNHRRVLSSGVLHCSSLIQDQPLLYCRSSCSNPLSTTMASSSFSTSTTSATPHLITLANGVQMPRIGLGTWKLSKSEEVSKAVKNCLKSNYQLIDTASVYRNESFIATELSKFDGYEGETKIATANGKGVFITSKAGPHQMGFDKAYNACLQTLENLAVDSIDLYLLHWPGVAQAPPTSDIHRKVRHECWKALEKLYREKKVRAIGVSNFLRHHLEGLIQDGVEVMPMVDQLELHPLCPNWELRQTAQQLGIVVQAYSSLGSGSKELVDHPVVIEVSETEDRPVCQILLRWAIQSNIIVIPRSTSLKHLSDNMNVFNWELSSESMDKLNGICPKEKGSSGEIHFCWNPISIP